MSEKMNFAWPVTSVNREDYEEFDIWYENNKEILQDCRVAIWGAGIRGTEFSYYFKRKGFTNLFFVDSNEQKWGGYIDEFLIVSPKELDSLRKQEKVLVLISAENSVKIEADLNKKNFRKNQDYFVVKTDLYEKYVAEFLREYKNGTLVMGDCEFSKISVFDKDDRNLREMLLEKCEKEDMKVLAMHGMGLRAHYNIFRGQIMNEMKPKRLVLMINFDTLTGKQHLLPRSQHTELLQLLLRNMKKSDAEFEEYVALTEERSKNIQMEFFIGTEKAGGNTEVKCRNYFKLNYMYELDTETEGVRYLLKILDVADAEGIKVIPFVPPVNYQMGRNLFGEVFEEKYNKNLQCIKRILAEREIELLDLSYALTMECFAEPTTPDETANEVGRGKIAKVLYEVIKETR
ncbi:MAG: hypothetical protein E7268_07985 [Lachnospiraceae bacterium]|nr:hypothetical protein [Lachnospiraceae bacterium]